MIETCSIDISCTVDIFLNFSFMYICFGNLNLLLSFLLHFANYLLFVLKVSLFIMLLVYRFLLCINPITSYFA